MRWLCGGSLLVLLLIFAGCSSSDESQGTSQTAITPVRVSEADNGSLLVTDYQSQSVRLLDKKNLESTNVITITGYPLAIGSFGERIFVGNETRRCVEVYSSKTGVKLYDLGDGPGSVVLPNDLAIDVSKGWVYVIDTASDRILVFSADGPLLSTIVVPQVRLGDIALIRPSGIAIDTTSGELFVSVLGNDARQAAILVFDPQGILVRNISGAFCRPQGLALDGGNRLFLVDANLGQVLVLNRNTGEELQRLGELAPYVGQHKLPLDLVWDGNVQRLFVSDFLLGRIVTFNLAGSAP